MAIENSGFFPLNMVIFDNYVSLPEGRCNLMILDVVHTEAEVF